MTCSTRASFLAPVLFTAALASSPALAQESKAVGDEPATQSPKADDGKDLPPSPFGPIVGTADLQLEATPGELTVRLRGTEPEWFGLVLLSASSRTEQVFSDLPPLLTDFTTFVFAQEKRQEAELQLPYPKLAGKLRIYAQAMILDRWGLSMSGLVSITLPQ